MAHGEEVRRVRGFGELEAVIMDRLWARGEPATVREVLTDLRQHREIAYTTVLTVMENLHKKGVLRREPAGRANRYVPMKSREQYVAQMMGQALEDSGDRAEALMHFVGRMTLDDAAALRSALSAYERKIAGR
ncbi:MAG: CopY family transcriptional regulator [Dactylosporangium sp.]|jgi:predicted transcriptional regulator|nr:CopY family transcriptional regulator [Dactylosporangium sp.]